MDLQTLAIKKRIKKKEKKVEMKNCCFFIFHCVFCFLVLYINKKKQRTNILWCFVFENICCVLYALGIIRVYGGAQRHVFRSIFQVSWFQTFQQKGQHSRKKQRNFWYWPSKIFCFSFFFYSTFVAFSAPHNINVYNNYDNKKVGRRQKRGGEDRGVEGKKIGFSFFPKETCFSGMMNRRIGGKSSFVYQQGMKCLQHLHRRI